MGEEQEKEDGDGSLKSHPPPLESLATTETGGALGWRERNSSRSHLHATGGEGEEEEEEEG